MREVAACHTNVCKGTKTHWCIVPSEDQMLWAVCIQTLAASFILCAMHGKVGQTCISHKYIHISCEETLILQWVFCIYLCATHQTLRHSILGHDLLDASACYSCIMLHQIFRHATQPMSKTFEATLNSAINQYRAASCSGECITMVRQAQGASCSTRENPMRCLLALQVSTMQTRLSHPSTHVPY